MNALRYGRLTALRKPDGGVRAIVVGDVFRRVVARTIAQQYTKKVEEATAPHQYALKTKAGCETVAHILQVLTDLDPDATVVSVDGVGAFDLISRHSMMEGLRPVVDGEQILPFVKAFYGQPSTYLWEDDSGEVHTIPQGEGGEQGDPLMPYSSALASTLLSPQRRRPSWKRERSSSHSWTICTSFADPRGLEPFSISWRDRCGSIPGSLSTWGRQRCGTGVGFSLQRVLHCRVLQSRFAPPRGDSKLPTHQQGFKVLGIPSGPMASAAFVAIPSMKETRIDPQPFRLLFLRRLRLPLPLQPRSCRCGRPLDVLGHHRAACANAGVLGRRGWVLENVAARVCREAGRTRQDQLGGPRHGFGCPQPP